jgi:hypothetical protein
MVFLFIYFCFENRLASLNEKNNKNNG